MLAGDHINTSEDRAVLHTALRLPREATLTVDGQDVVADVHAVLDKMGEFTDRVRDGRGAAPPVNASRPSSTSVSAGRTWVR